MQQVRERATARGDALVVGFFCTRNLAGGRIAAGLESSIFQDRCRRRLAQWKVC